MRNVIVLAGLGLILATIAIVVSGVLRGLVYLWLYWRTRRNDVRAFIAQPRLSEPPPQ